MQQSQVFVKLATHLYSHSSASVYLSNATLDEPQHGMHGYTLDPLHSLCRISSHLVSSLAYVCTVFGCY